MSRVPTRGAPLPFPSYGCPWAKPGESRRSRTGRRCLELALEGRVVRRSTGVAFARWSARAASPPSKSCSIMTQSHFGVTVWSAHRPMGILHTCSLSLSCSSSFLQRFRLSRRYGVFDHSLRNVSWHTRTGQEIYKRDARHVQQLHRNVCLLAGFTIASLEFELFLHGARDHAIVDPREIGCHS